MPPEQQQQQEEDALSLLSTYMRMWVCSQVVQAFVGNLTRLGNWEIFQLCVLALCFVFPRRRNLSVIAVSLRIIHVFSRLPATWDSEWFEMLTDIPLIISLVISRVPTTAMKYQVGAFYSAAGILKWNSSFLDPRFSCASTYGFQLLAVSGLYKNERLTMFVYEALPTATVVWESATGFCLLLGAPITGALLALLLHAGIAVTPPPNNIAVYGIGTVTRLFWLRPDSARAVTIDAKYHLVHVAVASIFLALTLESRDQFQSIFSVDPSPFVYGYVASIVACSLFVEDKTRRQHKCPRSLSFVSFVLMTLWAFFSVVLGIQGDISVPNMFANLGCHGGSNGVVPTGLMQRWLVDEETSVYGGGVVRVESCNSTYINSIHPGDLTEALDPKVHQLYKDHDHASCHFWNPALAIVVGPEVMPPPPRTFLPYTVPYYELARVLHKATIETPEETFQLTFARLPGVTGDADWRQYAVRRRIELTIAPSGDHQRRTCFVKGGENDSDYECRVVSDWLRYDAFDDNFLNRIGKSLLAFNSYVVLPDAPMKDNSEIHCYSS